MANLVRQWIAQVWADVKASTDASLLGVIRWLGLLYGPIDRRLPIDQALRKALGHRLPAHVGWRHALGSITYLLFVILVVTGVLLALYYRPSAQEAYPSIQHIVSEVSFGWLIRDVHVWSASLIVVVMLAHLVRVFVDVAYKPPRETNWLIGLLLLIVVLAFGATGYLLPWDQWSYWTVVEVLDTTQRLPILGPTVAALLTGDVVVSGATLSRYFAIHVIILPWVAFALLAFHFGLLRRHGIAPPKHDATVSTPGVRFFPTHLLRSFITALLVVAFVISAAVLSPRSIGEPANPYQVPDALVTSWAPVDVALAVTRYLGPWGIVGFVVLGVALAMLPLIDRSPERELRRHPTALVIGGLLALSVLGAWIAGRRLTTVAPRTAPSVEAPAVGQEEPLRGGATPGQATPDAAAPGGAP